MATFTIEEVEKANGMKISTGDEERFSAADKIFLSTVDDITNISNKVKETNLQTNDVAFANRCKDKLAKTKNIPRTIFDIVYRLQEKSKLGKQAEFFDSVEKNQCTDEEKQIIEDAILIAIQCERYRVVRARGLQQFEDERTKTFTKEFMYILGSSAPTASRLLSELGTNDGKENFPANKDPDKYNEEVNEFLEGKENAVSNMKANELFSGIKEQVDQAIKEREEKEEREEAEEREEKEEQEEGKEQAQKEDQETAEEEGMPSANEQRDNGLVSFLKKMFNRNNACNENKKNVENYDMKARLFETREYEGILDENDEENAISWRIVKTIKEDEGLKLHIMTNGRQWIVCSEGEQISEDSNWFESEEGTKMFVVSREPDFESAVETLRTLLNHEEEGGHLFHEEKDMKEVEDKQNACDTFLILDDDGQVFMPVPDEDDFVELRKCTAVLTTEEWETCGAETMEDVRDIARELMSDEEEEESKDSDTLLVVDDEERVFIPVPAEDGRVELCECNLFLTMEEWEACGMETLEDVKDWANEILSYGEALLAPSVDK